MSGAVDFYGMGKEEVVGVVESWGFAGVHGRRLWGYLLRENVGSVEEMVELPVRLRERISGEARVELPVSVLREVVSTDGVTRKYLLGLRDGEKIEAVLMRYSGRVTGCLSSQVGCAMGCVFCATGQMGFTRQLSAGEIVGQALWVDRVLRRGLGGEAVLARAGESPFERHERLRNVVLMGMGEPLNNYEAVMKAVDILRDGTGFGLSGRRISLSTVGVVPGIVRMADEGREAHLAVSLHSANQARRAAMVPAARAWNLGELMGACRYYSEKLERRIFFEWTLVDGENDSEEAAREAGELLKGMRAQVNLIPLNVTAGFAGAASGAGRARKFQEVLKGFGVPSTVRQFRGVDIGAGCGQLAGG